VQPAAGRAGPAFHHGFATNLLNPRIAMLYRSLLPQFIDPGGSMLTRASSGKCLPRT
jgi:threonine/homoserine/homoserine lactone efflux protein